MKRFFLGVLIAAAFFAACDGAMEVPSYTVVYDANGGEGTMEPSVFTYGKPHNLRANAFALEGSRFNGWEDRVNEKTYSDKQSVKNLTKGSSITLYAMWKIAEFKVSFESSGGTAVADQYVLPGEYASRPSNPIRGTDVLVNWYSDAECTEVFSFLTTPIIGDITLYAKWVDANTQSFFVTFYSNGGTEVEGFTVYLGELIGKPADPTRPDHTFKAWVLDNGYEYNFSYPVSGHITLYAKWDIAYYVQYDANEGIGTMEQTTHTWNIARNLPACTFTCEGYTFAGWSKTPEGETEYEDGASVTNLAATETAGAQVTLYAIWAGINYTVTYNNGGGNGEMESTPFIYGTAQNLPACTFTKTGHTFAGWAITLGGEAEFDDEESVNKLTSVNGGTVTLYAVWEFATIVPGDGLAAKLAWLESNVFDNTDYTVEVNYDEEEFEPYIFTYPGMLNVSVKLIGTGSTRTVSLYGNGSMFTVGAGVTLILDDKITLKGHEGNNASLIMVYSNGKLVMNEGSKITGNNATYGGGVYINGSYNAHGTFTMNGGVISNNTASLFGGGVYGHGSSNAGYTIILNDGTITQNKASSYGGGVCAYDSQFSNFTMNGGSITDNTSTEGSGGGIYAGLWSSGRQFTMNGGTISGNTAYSGGGIQYRGNFILTGGEISGNTATYSGGGVYGSLENSNFKMSGGAISGNTAVQWGGGVGINAYGLSNVIFTKTGGEIFGYKEGDVHSNKVSDGETILEDKGHAVYVNTINASDIKRRESAADQNLDMDYSKEGGEGGWEYFTITVSGANLTAKLDWWASNAVDTGTYIIEVEMDDNEVVSRLLSVTNCTVILRGIRGADPERKITIPSNGYLFQVTSGVTLVLDNITLQGKPYSYNTTVLVSVGAGGTVIMQEGSKITGNMNESTYGSGGGVSVSGGTFIMNGGEISNNEARATQSSGSTSASGGGVYISSAGTFIMNAGTITGNSARGTALSGWGNGGGVYVASGTFIMKGGIISNNWAKYYDSSRGYGGGVYVTGSSSSFIKDGGMLYGYPAGSDVWNLATVSNVTPNAVNGRGHALYSFTGKMGRDATAGETDDIDTTTGKGLSATGLAPYEP